MTTPMSPALIVLLMTLLLSVQPVATDLYLPSLPALTADLGASLAQAQLTLSALLLSFGLSQLIWGPMSDRYGRRPILIAGLIAYTISGIGAAFAATMEALIIWRVIQGAAMAAAVMCARAIVRDLYSPEIGARVISKALTGLGVVALISGPLGGVIAHSLNWRWAMLAISAFGALATAAIVMRFRETVDLRYAPPLQVGTLIAGCRNILSNHTFWAFALLTSSSYAILFIYLAASSFVFIEVYGFSTTRYGLMIALMSAAYVSGTIGCRRLLLHLSVRHTVMAASLLTLTAGVLLGVLYYSGVRSAWGIIAPMVLMVMAHGVHQPCGQSGAVGPFPRTAGMASALTGALMMGLAFVIGGWIGRNLDGTARVMVDSMVLFSCVTALVAWVVVRRVDEPKPIPQGDAE